MNGEYSYLFGYEHLLSRLIMSLYFLNIFSFVSVVRYADASGAGKDVYEFVG